MWYQESTILRVEMKPADTYPILFERRWPARGLHRQIEMIDVDALCEEYQAFREHSPRRSASGLRYLGGRTGIPSTTAKTNRQEEHYAIALKNLERDWPTGTVGWRRLIDYQVPLKASQADRGIGKMDLLAISDKGRLVIVELKVPGKKGKRSDPPPAALIEGLRYAAIAEANIRDLAFEAAERSAVRVSLENPVVQILAPAAYWRNWLDLAAAGEWAPRLAQAAEAISIRLDVPIEFMALEDVELVAGRDGSAPRLQRAPTLHRVFLSPAGTIGPALEWRDRKDGPHEYRNRLNEVLWNFAERNLQETLDRKRSPSRPPVLRKEFAALNVIGSPEADHTERIRNAIPVRERHRHFASLKSSQALTQSVFGTLFEYDALQVLESIRSECGRPAFFTKSAGWKPVLEYMVRSMHEPRPTSIDVWFEHDDGGVVAVECKLAEEAFGTCSRTRRSQTDAQWCDGNYTVQLDRRKRCSLSEIGVRYWELLPELFAWDAMTDLHPCPFSQTYQLGRNALAAVYEKENGKIGRGGHALVVYDARNPAFHGDGYAQQQWNSLLESCLIPGLVRRVSWQVIVQALSVEPRLDYLVLSLREKYGILA